MFNPFRKRRSRTDDASQTDIAQDTQDAFAQTSNTEFPTSRKVSMVEASTSTILEDRKPSDQRVSVSKPIVTDTAVNTSNISIPALSKVSMIDASTSTQWEGSQRASDQLDNRRSRQLSIPPVIYEDNVKDATVQTSATNTPPTRSSWSDRFGDWVGRKGSNRISVSASATREGYSDKWAQTSYLDIPETPTRPQTDKETSIDGEDLHLSDQQHRKSISNLSPSEPNTGLRNASVALRNSSDLERNDLTVNKPVVIFPADKPGLFFMPGITSLPLLAPFPPPPFFPPLPPSYPSLPPPPFDIPSLPIIQPLRHIKPKSSLPVLPREEAATSPTESSQDISRALYKCRKLFSNSLKSRRSKKLGDDYDADYSKFLCTDSSNREETNSYTCKCHEHPRPAPPNGLCSGDEIPTQRGTFICEKYGAPRKHKTYICSAKDKRCSCQKDKNKFKQPPSLHGAQTTFCPNCQCRYCCLPTSTVATSRCGFARRNGCDGSACEDDVTHTNASLYRSIQLCLRNSNTKKNSKVKKYNFSFETLKLLGTLFTGTRSTSVNCKEVTDCHRTKCYRSHKALHVDDTSSTAVHQTPTTSSCTCGASSSSSTKQKVPASSTLKCSPFGRHLKQLLKKFDTDLCNLPHRGTFQPGDDECGKVNNSCPGAEKKCPGTEDNDIKCNSAGVTCNRSDAMFTFCDGDMFNPQSCSRVYNGCRDIQDRCGYFTCAKRRVCDQMSCDNTCAKTHVCDQMSCDNTCAKTRVCDQMSCDNTCAKTHVCDKMSCDNTRAKTHVCDEMSCDNTCTKTHVCDQMICDNTRAKKNMCDEMSCDKPDCYQNLVHCYGCKCECCRVTENPCIKEIKTLKEVCSVSSQTNITPEKTSKQTSPGDNPDSTFLFQPIAEEVSPSQEKLHTPTTTEKETHTSTTAEIVDLEADVSKTDTEPAAADQNSNVATSEQQQAALNCLEQEIIPETEIKSINFQCLPAIEDHLFDNSCVFKRTFPCSDRNGQSARQKPCSDEYHQINRDYPNMYTETKSNDNKHISFENPATNDRNARIPHDGRSSVKEQSIFSIEEGNVSKPADNPKMEMKNKESEPETIVKSRKESKANGKPPTAFIDCKNESKTPQQHHVHRCKDCQHEDIYTREQPEQLGQTYTHHQQGSHEYDRLKTSIFCAIKRKSVKIKDADFLQKSGNSRHAEISHFQKDNAMSPRSVYRSQPPYIDTARDVEVCDMNTAEENTESRQVSAGINGAMSNSKFTNTAGGKCFRNSFSRRDDSQEQSTICNVPDLDSEISELRGQRGGNKHVSQHLHTQTGIDSDAPHPKQPGSMALLHDDDQQVKRNNTFACKRNHKHHKMESSAHAVIRAFGDKNTTPSLPGDGCQQKHNDCASQGDFVKPTHTGNQQIKQDEREQESVANNTTETRNADQFPPASVGSTIISKTFQLPNVHRCRDCQIDEVDIIRQHELHNHKGYISNRKQLQITRELDNKKVSIFCSIKNKSKKCKEADYAHESEGGRCDTKDDNEKLADVNSRCGVCRSSRPSCGDTAEDVEPSDIDNVTPGDSEKRFKPCVSGETVSSKVEDSVGIIYAMSNSKYKDSVDPKLFGSTFSCKDNSQEQSTTYDLPDLDSETPEMRGQKNLLMDISELLRAQASTNKDSYNPNHNASESGEHGFSKCSPASCQNSIFQCNYCPKLQENRTNDRRDCSCTNLGHHLLVCRPCSRQFGPNHCLRQGTQHIHPNHSSNDCVHPEQCVACQSCRIENCRFGCYFIVKSNCNITENSQNISIPYLDPQDESLTTSCTSLNTPGAEPADLPHPHSTNYRLYFECTNIDSNKQSTPSPCLACFQHIFSKFAPVVSSELGWHDNVHSQDDTHRTKSEKSQQGDSFTISKTVTGSQRIRLCLERGCRYNSHGDAHNLERCRKVHNRNLTEPGQEEAISNTSDHITRGKQDVDSIVSHNSKRSQTDLGKTISSESCPSQQELINTVSNHSKQSNCKLRNIVSNDSKQELSNNVRNGSSHGKRELSNHVSNDSNPSQQELSNNVRNGSSQGKRELSNHVSNDSNPSQQELSNNVRNGSSHSKRELSNHVSNDSNPSQQELSNNVRNGSSQGKRELSNHVSNDSNPSQQELSNNVRNGSSHSKRELSNHVSNDSNPSQQELSNNVRNGSSHSKRELSNHVSNDSNPSQQELSNNVRNGSSQGKRELSNHVSNDSNPSQQELSNNVRNGSSHSKRELSNHVSNDSNPSQQELSNNVRNGSSHSKRELSNHVSNESNHRKQKLSNNVSNDSNPSHRELSNNVSNDNMQRKKELTDSANNVSEISNYELSNTVSKDSNTSKQELSNVISNHVHRSDSEASNIASNHSKRKNNDKINGLSNYSKISKRDLCDTVSKENNEELDTIINIDIIVNKQEKSNDVSNYSKKREPHNHIIKDIKIMKRCIDNTASYDSKRNQKDLNNAVRNESNFSTQEIRKAINNDSSSSKRKINNSVSNHNTTIQRGSSHADFNSEDRSHTDSSDTDPNHRDRKHKDLRDTEPCHRDRKHKDLRDTEPCHRDRKHKDLRDTEPRHRDQKYKDLRDTEHCHRDQKYKDLRDTEPHHKDRKHKVSSDQDPNHTDQKHKDQSEAGNNYKDRKHKDPNDTDPNHDELKRTHLSYAVASRTDRKHKDSSEVDPSHKDLKYKDPSDADNNYKNRKHKHRSFGDPKHKDRNHKDPTDADPNHKDRKHNDSSDAVPNHKDQKHKDPSYTDFIDKAQQHKDPSYTDFIDKAQKYKDPSYTDFIDKDQKYKDPSYTDFIDKAQQHKDPSYTDFIDKAQKYKDPSYTDVIGKDQKHRDEDDSEHGVSGRAHSNHDKQNHQGCTLNYSVSFSDAGKQRYETHNNITCTNDQTELSVRTETNILPIPNRTFHETTSRPQEQGRIDIGARDLPCSNCQCRKKGKRKLKAISDDDDSVVSKKYETVKQEHCQIHRGPCYICAGPQVIETIAQEISHVNQCPAIGSVHENQSSLSLSESQGFPSQTFTTSAPQKRKRKHHTNIAHPCKWQPNEIYPHFHSPDCSQLQDSSNSLCKEKEKPYSSRNRSPELFSNSFGSSDALNGFHHWQTGEPLPALCSQCQNLSYQSDSYMGVHPKQPSSNLSPSHSQCIDSNSKEPSGSSHRTGSSRTDSFTCSSRLCNLMPCLSCGLKRRALGRQKNCCETSYTSVV